MSDSTIIKETSLLKRKKKLIIIIAVLFVIVIIGIFFAVRHFSKDTGSGKVYVESVSEILGYGSLGASDRFTGVVESQKAVAVNADSNKTIKTCFVHVGDQVTAGTQLFEYDTDEINQSIEEHQLEIDKLNIQINSAKQQITQLEAEKAAASSDEQLSYTMEIQSLNTDIASNQYDVNSKQTELDKLKASLSNAIVTSTVDGIIKSIGDAQGSGFIDDEEMPGSSTESAYISILPIGDYQIKGVLTELNMGALSEGTDVLITSRVDGTKKVKGKVASIDFNNPISGSSDSDMMMSEEGSSAGESAAKWNFYVSFENTENLILGQHVFVEPDYGQAETKEGLWLPEFFMDQNDDGSYFVWKESNGKLIKQELELGEYNSELMEYEILNGLSTEDYIAFPSDQLTEGIPVTHSLDEADDFDDMGDGEGMDGMGDDEGMDDMTDDEGMDDIDNDENMNGIEDTENIDGENPDDSSSGDLEDLENPEDSEDSGSEDKEDVQE